GERTAQCGAQMRAPASERWIEGNRHWLLESIGTLGSVLEGFAAGAPRAAQQTALPHDLPAPPALEGLAQAFGVSPFGREVVLLCAGMELSDSFAAQCGKASGDPTTPHPTFALALVALAYAHWSAVTPAAPLRRFRLIELLPGEGLTRSPLRIDERVLHYL